MRYRKLFFKKKENKDPEPQTSNGSFERCILCGQTTDISVDTPIAKRSGFIKGCGQLCPLCDQKIREKMRGEN